MPKGMGYKEHMPSEVDRLHQGANPPMRQSKMGSMGQGSAMPSVSHSPAEVSRESQTKAAPVSSGDGLGKMMHGMGGTRSSMTTPSKPPKQKKAGNY